VTTALDRLPFDPGSPGQSTRPDHFDVLRRLRAEDPVHRYAPHRWAVARYDDVRTVSRDPERFCSGRGVLLHDPKRDGADLPGSILHMDPPRHAEWRKVGSRWFTPRAVARLEQRVRAVVGDVLDEVAPGEPIDVVDAMAAPIPVLVIAELLGLGDADRSDLRRWSDACIEGADDDPEGGAAAATALAVGELLEFLDAHARARRDRPGDDLLSALASAEVEGRAMGADEVVLYCMSLLVAGNETTRHLLSGSVALLAEHPDQRAALVGEPATIPGAVEECLRMVTPIQTMVRTATCDLELGGQAVAAGDWVVLLYASANRDEAVFGPDAERFDVTRPPHPAHLAFGFGEHLCLGASLARLEARVFLEELLARFPAFAITGEPTWTRSTLVRGHVSLPAVMA
jgi:cytochrome P450